MAIIHHKDKRTGITYVYESESYWDKEKKQPRSRRTLIGKIDEATGAVVPTDGRGRKRGAGKAASSADATLCEQLREQVRERERRITELEKENSTIRKELSQLMQELSALIERHNSEQIQ